jgi:hypothetical protein
LQPLAKVQALGGVGGHNEYAVTFLSRVNISRDSGPARAAEILANQGDQLGAVHRTLAARELVNQHSMARGDFPHPKGIHWPGSNDGNELVLFQHAHGLTSSGTFYYITADGGGTVRRAASLILFDQKARILWEGTLIRATIS